MIIPKSNLAEVSDIRSYYQICLQELHSSDKGTARDRSDRRTLPESDSVAGTGAEKQSTTAPQGCASCGSVENSPQE